MKCLFLWLIGRILAWDCLQPAFGCSCFPGNATAMVSLNNLDEQIGALEEDEEEEPEDNVWDESHTMCLFHDACVLNWIVRRQPSRHIQIIQHSGQFWSDVPTWGRSSLTCWDKLSSAWRWERFEVQKDEERERPRRRHRQRRSSQEKEKGRTVTDRDGPDEIIFARDRAVGLDTARSHWGWGWTWAASRSLPLTSLSQQALALTIFSQ